MPTPTLGSGFFYGPGGDWQQYINPIIQGFQTGGPYFNPYKFLPQFAQQNNISNPVDLFRAYEAARYQTAPTPGFWDPVTGQVSGQKNVNGVYDSWQSPAGDAVSFLNYMGLPGGQGGSYSSMQPINDWALALLYDAGAKELGYGPIDYSNILNRAQTIPNWQMGQKAPIYNIPKTSSWYQGYSDPNSVDYAGGAYDPAQEQVWQDQFKQDFAQYMNRDPSSFSTQETFDLMGKIGGSLDPTSLGYFSDAFGTWGPNGQPVGELSKMLSTPLFQAILSGQGLTRQNWDTWTRPPQQFQQYPELQYDPSGTTHWWMPGYTDWQQGPIPTGEPPQFDPGGWNPTGYNPDTNQPYGTPGGGGVGQTGGPAFPFPTWGGFGGGGAPAGGGFPGGGYGGQGSPFDWQMWQGPYGAPMTDLQLDAMGGFSRMMNANPILQQQDLQAAIQRGFEGIPMPNFGNSDLTKANQFLNMGVGGAGAGGIIGAGFPALTNALNPRGFDQTAMFQNAENVFNADLDKRLAGVREEMSAMGLNPGAADRSRILGETAGTALSNFRVGQQQVAEQAFENQQRRGLEALGMFPSFGQVSEMPLNRTLSGAGLASNFAQVPFGENLARAQLQGQLGLGQQGNMLSALPTLANIYQMPAQLAAQGFQMGTVGQQTADQQIARMMQEYGRTQGQALNQAIGLMSGVPMNQIGYGPSQLSQWSNLLFGGLGLANQLGWNPFGGGGGGGGGGYIPQTVGGFGGQYDPTRTGLPYPSPRYG